MIMKTNRFRSKFREFSSILRNEYRHIFHDAGVILIVIGAIFIYSTAYSLAYKNEVLRNVPVAVVDNSHTAQSRQLVRALDATPNLRVAYKSSSLEEAKRLFHERKINGIIVIPSDYEKKIMRNERVNISIYADASYFLMYRQVFFDVMGSVLYSNSQIEWVRFVAKGAQPGQAAALSNPVQTTIENMYNPYGGYATFIMPAILIVIIQHHCTRARTSPPAGARWAAARWWRGRGCRSWPCSGCGGWLTPGTNIVPPTIHPFTAMEK